MTKEEKNKRGLFSRMFSREEKAQSTPETNAEEPRLEEDSAAQPTQATNTPPSSGTDTAISPPAQEGSPQEAGQAEDKKNPPKGFFARLRAGLSRSSGRLTDGVSAIFTKRKLDDQLLEELEDLLITADLGVTNAARITAKFGEGRFDKEIDAREVKKFLAEEIAATLKPLEQGVTLQEHGPTIILMIGVNGAGKTTTIGKLARKFKQEGKSVMLAAGDTFRAAAIEQLSVWGERNHVPVIARKVGSDAAGLAFEAVQQAQAQNTDVLLIDTAGRLQNRRELMDELAKIVRVIKKLDDTAPHHTVLVLDATVGQNALSQAESFRDIAGVTGLVMTKLDGTARGGVLVALADKFGLPIHFIGVGEQAEDLQPFNATTYSQVLVGLETKEQDK